jgi:hypothetical protein
VGENFRPDAPAANLKSGACNAGKALGSGQERGITSGFTGIIRDTPEETGYCPQMHTERLIGGRIFLTAEQGFIQKKFEMVEGAAWI